jgi:hypothetical protein
MGKLDLGYMTAETSDTAIEVYKALLDLSIKGLEYQGQQENPLVSFTLSNGVAVALRPNKRSPSLYLLNQQKNGLIEHYLNSLKLTFYKDSDPHEAIKNGKVKGLENKKDVVMISEISITDFEKVMDFICPTHGLSFDHGKYVGRKKELSPEELLKKLECQSEIGARGEELLFEKLKADFRVEGNPKKSLIHTSKENSSAGYDIEYHFDAEHRYIEVKTTTQKMEADFFFSINEYNVLETKADEGFIYRVVLDAELEKIIDLKEIKNPFGVKKISPKESDTFEAIIFKANVSDFEK